MTARILRHDATADLVITSNSRPNPQVFPVCSDNCRKLTVGSLFAGIGGFDLGLERTGGFEIRWQVEIDEYCRRVLEKHWPHVQRYGDIREVTDVERVDVLCGGFPCQDISDAGSMEGIDGRRSGLWREMARLIRLVRPQYVVVENVAALLDRGLERVLRDLAEIGLHAEWHCIPAVSIGAPHRRDRLWILAYPDSERLSNAPERVLVSQKPTTQSGDWNRWTVVPSRLQRVVDGISTELDSIERLTCIGNAVVPQIVTWIGERILEWEAAHV